MPQTYDFEHESDLVKRLKATYAVLRTKGVSPIERYAAIAELALSRNTEKVGVLTLGLFDETNHQVRELAGDALRSYGLEKTVDALLKGDGEAPPLLKGGRSGLRKIFYTQPQLLTTFLKQLKPLFQQKRISGGSYADYGLRHALVILKNLAYWLDETQTIEQTSDNDSDADKEQESYLRIATSEEEQDAHSFTRWFEDQEQRWILERVLHALEQSEDIYSRRSAIGVLGTLLPDLHYDNCAFTYTLIRQTIDSPQNRHDYRVTWTSLEALTALVQRYPEHKEQFCLDLLDIFKWRTYPLDNPNLAEAHRYNTRLHCIEAMSTLCLYDQLKSLTEQEVADHPLYLPMMTFAPKSPIVFNAIRRAKRAYIKAFQHIYLQESQFSADCITERQEDILHHMRKWVASKDSSVRELALDFFERLPNIEQALRHLLESAHENEAQLATLPSSGQEKQKVIRSLFEKRKQFAIVLGNTLTKHTPKTEEEKDIQQQVVQLLFDWVLHLVQEKDLALPAFQIARLEALWTLYNYELAGQGHTLSTEKLAELLRQEHDPALLSILSLFSAHLSSNPVQELKQIAHDQKNSIQVRVCAEMELLSRWPQDISEDISEDLIVFLPSNMSGIGDTKLHLSLTERFIPRLVTFDTEGTSRLIGKLLQNDYRLPHTLFCLLRENLSQYHCYTQRVLLFNKLLQDLPLRHTEKGRLFVRLDYLNLLWAGMYAAPAPKEKLAIPNPVDSTQKRTLTALQSIALLFKDRTLPILDSSNDHDAFIPLKDAECVVALPGLTEDNINTLLYAVPTEKAGQSVIEGYLHTEKFPRVLTFLQNPRTDSEIARILRKYVTDENPQRPAHVQLAKRHISILGRVMKAQDGGVSIDVGLLDYLPFVSRKQMAGQEYQAKDSDNWLHYMRYSLGSIFPFRICSITFSQQSQGEMIEKLELEHDFSSGYLNTSIVDAQLKKVEADDKSNYAVFQTHGVNLRVPVQELSWQVQADWVQKGWQAWFEQRIGQTYALTSVKPQSYWSLRQQKATLEHFIQLLYQMGGTSFDLTYIDGLDDGYIFEHEPGQNCYVPADRLGRLEENNFQFFLPNPELKTGHRLKVHFSSAEIEGEMQVVLRLDGEFQTNEDVYPKGKLITGKLECYLDAYKGVGKLSVPDLDASSMTTVLIHGLPAHDRDARVAVGSSVNGQITYYNPYKNELSLDFTQMPPKDLEMDKIYYCQVLSDPERIAYKMLLRYGHVTGDLYERDMTYRHTPTLKSFCKDYRDHKKAVPVRLLSPQKWEEVYKRTVPFPLKADALADLGIKDQTKAYKLQGIVVRIHQNRFTIIHNDDTLVRAFYLSLDNFSFESARPPDLYIGNRVTVSYSPRQINMLSLSVERASARFTLLPDLYHSDTWRTLDEALLSNQSKECVYIGRIGSHCLLEAEPGMVFPLPPEYMKYGTYWLTNNHGSWRLCEQLGKSRATSTYVQVTWEGEQDTHDYPVHIGDFLTLLHRSDGSFQLQNFRPGPLHFAATPELFDERFDLVDWMQKANRDAPLQLIGKVLPFAKSGSKQVELTSIRLEQDIPLRSGIQGSYYASDMSPQQQQSLQEDTFEENYPIVNCVLSGPPGMYHGPRGPQLSLQLKSPTKSTNEIEQPATISLAERLRELQPMMVVTGTIASYDRKQKAFRINLDLFAEFPEQLCWLPVEEVSFSLMPTYDYTEAFTIEQPGMFTILHVDSMREEIIASLRANPRQSIESIADEGNWLDGQILSNITFISKEDESDSTAHQQIVTKETDEESQTQVANLAIEIELRPGYLITLPAGHFHQEEAYNLQSGDQIRVRIDKRSDHFEIHVVWAWKAQFNILYNYCRVVRAHIGQIVDEKIRLEPLDLRYRWISYFLDPTFPLANKADRSELSGYELFRVSDCNRKKKELYLTPVKAEELVEGDLLDVTYREVAGEQGIYVTYGQTYRGFVYRSHISYRPDFDHRAFNPRADKKIFLARVIRPAGARDVMLNIRDANKYNFNHLENFDLEQTSDEDTFFAVFVRKYIQTIDLEIYPGTIVHIPRSRISPFSKLVNVRQGDTLECRLALASSNNMHLQIINVIKSFLHTLTPKTVVQAHFVRRENEQWRFSLPEYYYHDAILTHPEGLLPDVLRQDFHLAVERLPIKSTDPIPLRLREATDQQQLVRVEHIEDGRIFVRREDGYEYWIHMSFVTYRLNNKMQYIRQTLPLDTILLVTKNREVLSFTANAKYPISLSSLYRRYAMAAEIELTYVRSEQESDSHIFEVRPGLFVSIAASVLFFNDYPMPDLRRFIVGDVFTAQCEAIIQGQQEQIRINVHAISLSLLRKLQPDQYIQAEVTDVTQKGIIFRANSLGLDGEYLSRDELLERATTPLTEGDSIWIKVLSVEADKRTYSLREVQSPSFRDLISYRAKGETQRLILYGSILQREKEQLTLEISTRPITVKLPAIAWSPAQTIQEVLPERASLGLWVYITAREDGTLQASSKAFLAAQIRTQIQKGDITLAKVLEINYDEHKTAKNVLLDVEGIFVLVKNEDIVWGLPSHLPAVRKDTWLSVIIEDVDHYENNQRNLLVSACNLNTALRDMSEGKYFKARVRYTMEHGLIFSYENSLGYISNEEITWHGEAKAADIFSHRDIITVYKQAPVTSRNAFSLKNASQLGKLKKGDEVETIVVRKMEQGAYLKICNLKGSDIWVFLTYAQAGVLTGMPENASCTLLIDKIDLKGYLLVLRLSEDLITKSEGTSQGETAAITAEYNAAYLIPLENLKAQLKQPKSERILKPQHIAPVSPLKEMQFLTPRSTVLADISVNEDVRKQIWALLEFDGIPCTYSTVRIIVGLLWEKASSLFWKQLAQCAPQEKDGPSLAYVIYRIAQVLTSQQYEPKDDEEFDLQDMRIESLIYYGVGITALSSSQQSELMLTPSTALRQLLFAYADYKSPDIEIALMLLYEKLHLFTLRRKFLQSIIQRFAHNMYWLLSIPHPIRCDKDYYPLLQEGREFITDINATLTNQFNRGYIKEASLRLKDIMQNLEAKRASVLCPVLYFNRSLCLIFQKDFEQALNLLKKCISALQEELRKLSTIEQPTIKAFHAATIYDAACQLIVYLHYHMRKFEDLQTFILSQYAQNSSSPYLHTWLGYLFFATKNNQLSQDSINHVSNKTTMPEAILLKLYWEDAEQFSPGPLTQCVDLEWKLLHNFDYTNHCDKTLPSIRFWPTQVTEPKDMLYAAKVYQAQNYVLQKYLDDPEPDKRFWDRISIIEMGRYTGRISAIKNPYKNTVTDIEQASMILAERWLKSPHEHDMVSIKLITLIQDQPAAIAQQLYNNYWANPALRRLLWRVFDHNMDYGNLIRFLPSQVYSDLLEMLEDIVFHLISYGLQQDALRLIELCQGNEQVQDYLQILTKLCSTEISESMERCCHYLCIRLDILLPNLSIDTGERQAAINALDILVAYPDIHRQARMLLLLGELHELEQNYEIAAQCYMLEKLPITEIFLSMRIRAALHLLRLRLHTGNALHAEFLNWRVDHLTSDGFIAYMQNVLQTVNTDTALANYEEVLEQLQIITNNLTDEGKLNPTQLNVVIPQIEILFRKMYQVKNLRNSLPALYALLIGTDPLDNWSPAQIWQILCPFMDYGFATRFHQELEEPIEEMLTATINHLMQKHTFTSAEYLTKLQQQQQDLSCLELWLLPHKLTSDPQRIEQVAGIALKFLQSGARLSASDFHKATRLLIAMLGSTHTAYSAATKKMVDLASGENGKTHES